MCAVFLRRWNSFLEGGGNEGLVLFMKYEKKYLNCRDIGTGYTKKMVELTFCVDWQ